MAGSNSWHQYQADNGKLYKVLVAKHVAHGIAQDVTGSARIFLEASGTLPELPRGFKMRYAHALVWGENNSGQTRPKSGASPIWKRVHVGNLVAWSKLYGDLQSMSFLRYPNDPNPTYWISSRMVGEIWINNTRADDPRLI